MTGKEWKTVREKYPEIRQMYEEFNGILQEDGEAWNRLVDKVHEISGRYKRPSVDSLLRSAVIELDRISRRKKDG